MQHRFAAPAVAAVCGKLGAVFFGEQGAESLPQGSDGGKRDTVIVRAGKGAAVAAPRHAAFGDLLRFPFGKRLLFLRDMAAAPLGTEPLPGEGPGGAGGKARPAALTFGFL